MRLFIAFMLLLFLSTACVQRPIHQGNDLDKDKVWLIQEGDNKFQVESTWGTPAILDALHPNRVEYVQQVKDKKTNETYVRGIIVEYDQALRVKHLQRYGF